MTWKLLPEEETAKKRVLDDLKLSSDHLRPWRDQCNENYRQYRTVSTAREEMRRSAPPDRDTIAHEMVREFGSDLHIPIAYSTIETMLPRTVSNRPRGLVMPEERMAEDNVENMRQLVEVQQARFRYELIGQETVKSGFLFGLGAQLGPYWKRTIQRDMPYITRATDAKAAGSSFVQSKRDVVRTDDAWCEDIDIFDLAWDPYGYDSWTLRWIAHRTWRDHEYVRDRLDSGEWDSPAARTITPEDITAMATGQAKMDGVWKDRMQVAGHTDFQTRGGALHEVWQYWTAKGGRITLLDGEVPVKVDRNPFWHGEMPFHFYRPQTAGIKQLHGISEVEPLSDLIRELDVLRSQRRDNAAIVLQQVFAFDEDAIDRENLVYGPGVGIPVRSDDPRAHLFPINQGDIPYSGYREEQALKEDLDRTSGISDTVTGAQGGGAAQTATGAQLITAAANVRIENKSHRYEAETVTPFTNQQIALNQQMIVEKDVRVPREPQPGETDPKAWEWITMTPAELAGLMSFHVEGGSSAPKNVAQDAQMGLNLWNILRGNPMVDEVRLLRHFLDSQGIKQPGTWIKPAPTVPPEVLQAFAKEFGPDKVQRIVQMVTGAQGG